MTFRAVSYCDHCDSVHPVRWECLQQIGAPPMGYRPSPVHTSPPSTKPDPVDLLHIAAPPSAHRAARLAASAGKTPRYLLCASYYALLLAFVLAFTTPLADGLRDWQAAIGPAVWLLVAGLILWLRLWVRASLRRWTVDATGFTWSISDAHRYYRSLSPEGRAHARPVLLTMYEILDDMRTRGGFVTQRGSNAITSRATAVRDMVAAEAALRAASTGGTDLDDAKLWTETTRQVAEQIRQDRAWLTGGTE